MMDTVETDIQVTKQVVITVNFDSGVLANFIALQRITQKRGHDVTVSMASDKGSERLELILRSRIRTVVNNQRNECSVLINRL